MNIPDHRKADQETLDTLRKQVRDLMAEHEVNYSLIVQRGQMCSGAAEMLAGVHNPDDVTEQNLENHTKQAVTTLLAMKSGLVQQLETVEKRIQQFIDAGVSFTAKETDLS